MTLPNIIVPVELVEPIVFDKELTPPTELVEPIVLDKPITIILPEIIDDQETK